MTKSDNFRCFPRYDLLSRCFHFGVFEIFVSNLFLLRFFTKIVIGYQTLTRNQQIFKKKITILNILIINDEGWLL